MGVDRGSQLGAPVPPRILGTYRLEQSHAYDNPLLDKLFRFAEPGGHRVDLFIYPDADSSLPRSKRRSVDSEVIQFRSNLGLGVE